MMSHMNPSDFVGLLGRVKASAILRTPHAEAAAPAMEAAVNGGFRVIEFTLTIPGAMERIAEYSRRDGLVVGAGTVLTTEDARAAVERGASFLVSPVVDSEIIELAASLGVAMLPGAYTPTEMRHAYQLGAPLVKLFPAPASGPDYVRACLAPMPFLRIVPTNGVDATNAASYLAAGAHAVGFAAALFAPADIQAKRFDRIEERARQLLASVSR